MIPGSCLPLYPLPQYGNTVKPYNQHPIEFIRYLFHNYGTRAVRGG